MYMVQRPYRISLKVGIDRKRSDRLLLFSRSLFHSLVLSAITHREAVFFFPSVSLSLFLAQTVLLIKELVPKVAQIL